MKHIIDELSQLHFNGEFGCTFCKFPGETLENGNKSYYPYILVHMQTDLRTHEEIKNKIETQDFTKGIKSVSSLLLLPGFRLSSGQVVDSFHNAYEGAAKRLMELTTLSAQHP